MRLINNESMALEEFMGSGIHVPEYAILSHTWDAGEVTFQDFIHPDKEVRQQKKGFGKIQQTCELASASGLKYSWVDTCCIDKTSSAELTEAINSMFQWYKASVVCYVWLADLPTEQQHGVALESESSPLKDCYWFTRGWTLQELIAPRQVEFYDREWNFRGTKTDLCEQIIEITKIGADVLADPRCLPLLSVAQRMSWASSRKTTRIEDMAYYLLGIFDVNMPMLYGEGERAFLRLQEEIAKSSNDLSLFAWRASSTNQTHHGVFAAAPADFRHSGSIRLIGDTVFNPEFSVTNKGLRVNIELYSGLDGAHVMKLNCAEETDLEVFQQVGIWILPHGGGVYGRVKADEFAPVDPGALLKSSLVYLFKTISEERSSDLEGSHSNAFFLRRGFNDAGKKYSPEFPFEAAQMLPHEEWDSQRRMFLTQGSSEFTGSGHFRKFAGSTNSEDVSDGASFFLAFGKCEGEDEPWITIASPFDGAELYQLMGNGKKLAEAARKREGVRSVLIMNKANSISHQVTASLEKATMSGRAVYCIDLIIEPAQEENLREDRPGVLSMLWKNRDRGKEQTVTS